MKAMLIKDRKVVVDVELVGKTSKMEVYRDKNTGKLYFDFQLDFLEYYGG